MGEKNQHLTLNIVLLISCIAKINAQELPVFEPPVFQPPAFEPSQKEPPVFQPTVFEPPVFQPPFIEPSIFEPPRIESPAFEPPRIEPPAFEPQSIELPATEPPRPQTPTPKSKCPDPLQTKTNPTLQGRLLTTEEGCGFSNVTHRRIVGGSPAKPGTFPWMALLGYRSNLGKITFKCGGSLITTRHVLSADHCILSTLYVVRLGEHDISSTTDGDVEDIDVVRVVRHPNYNRRDKTNDIAVIYLERDVEITLRIRPVCLPVDQSIRSRSFTGSNPFVAGWGRLQEGGSTSNVLQEVQLPILENSDCKERYQMQGKLISDEQFGETVLCVGVLTGGKDSCQGDSGGPLQMPLLEDNCGFRYYQVGIVSYGLGCARTDVPGVYTRVQHFINWIQEKIQE